MFGRYIEAAYTSSTTAASQAILATGNTKLLQQLLHLLIYSQHHHDHVESTLHRRWQIQSFVPDVADVIVKTVQFATRLKVAAPASLASSVGDAIKCAETEITEKSAKNGENQMYRSVQQYAKPAQASARP